MFMVGVAPALLVFLIRMHVKESPAFEARRVEAGARQIRLAEIGRHWKIALYLVVLMTAFNFFSHGTQDLYPTFLQKQHHFDTHMTGMLTAVMNLGAIVGGIGFGIWSERIGRKRAIIIASLLALPVIPLWAFAATPLLLGLGAFLIQVAVQGAWGIVPVHLNELSPPLGARPLPRLRLSARQSDRVAQRRRSRPVARPRQEALWPGACARCRRHWRWSSRSGRLWARNEGTPTSAGAEARPSSKENFVAEHALSAGGSVSSYRGTADRPDKAKAIVAVVACTRRSHY